MSALRTLVGLWKNHEETKEKPKLPELKTRYYKKSREVMIEQVKKIVNNNKFPNWKISEIDEERGEVTLVKQGMGSSIMVVTIFKINPVKSAIDIYCAKQGSFGDLGSSYKAILQFFKALHTEVTPED
ncbi:hypothetical protein [Halalkalibacter akibai]|uniref:Cytosolic protein n=1 Tax=Halalkalibacter akibai (strain ATCC 43226 / DSM 21942 / CIP 109018 / JCM 9157 / 1139) TaxID=1236973 RepID=W4QT38_HALA3|nr:hypothetical protein [Halalkalibacter akibai]GAE35266.1 hypothetical protein JCM9157_2367 [Halalkalibacter akibai JCM 9157]